MSTWQSAIVLFTIDSLRSQGSWCGETHVQKTLFLCQEVMNVASEFKFILYKHGPYSFELSEHLQALIADELICVRTRPPYGPSLETSVEAKALILRVTRDRHLASYIQFMSAKLGGKGVGELEKLATAIFLNKKHGSEMPVERRAEIFTSIKPHVSIDAARTAFREAENLVLDARQLAA